MFDPNSWRLDYCGFTSGAAYIGIAAPENRNAIPFTVDKFRELMIAFNRNDEDRVDELHIITGNFENPQFVRYLSDWFKDRYPHKKLVIHTMCDKAQIESDPKYWAIINVADKIIYT